MCAIIKKTHFFRPILLKTALTPIIGSDYAFSFNPSDFEEGTYIISVRAEDDKGFGYTNITIVIRFEQPFDFMPFVIIGAMVSLVICVYIYLYIKIPSWISARKKRRVQDSKLDKYN